MEDLWVRRFKRKALPVLISVFKPKEIIIFGSRISGKAHENSDIDVVMISDSFKNIPFIKRMPLVLKKAPFEKHVDYICYTPGEFNHLRYKSSVLMDALESGERVV